MKYTVRSHCESINYTINIRLINKRKYKRVSRLGNDTVIVTVQYTVNKIKH